ncbi:MAG TPA: orotate phosphoribosyltransferase [Coprothermobacter sp.]|jgi:orotate phosphoribosyltransferase|nr:orotate phosphoribosyltransferase [Coprothermobacter sp.]
MTVLEILEKRGAILHGHFLLASGKHSDIYVQCQRAFVYPEDTAFIAKELINKAQEQCDIKNIVGVVSPALGAVIIGYEVARQLDKPFLFAEREGGKLTFRRGFEIQQNGHYLTVEDVFTTGGSTLELINLVENMGGLVDYALAVVQRQKEIALPVPHDSLVFLNLPLYEPENCPLCKAGIPLVKPGTKQQQKPSS